MRLGRSGSYVPGTGLEESRVGVFPSAGVRVDMWWWLRDVSMVERCWTIGLGWDVSLPLILSSVGVRGYSWWGLERLVVARGRVGMSAS